MIIKAKSGRIIEISDEQWQYLLLTRRDEAHARADALNPVMYGDELSRVSGATIAAIRARREAEEADEPRRSAESERRRRVVSMPYIVAMRRAVQAAHAEAAAEARRLQAFIRHYSAAPDRRREKVPGLEARLEGVWADHARLTREYEAEVLRRMRELEADDEQA